MPPPDEIYIRDDAGKVLYLDANRFVRDIVAGDCCFICGISPEEAEFNREHVLPNWILNKYDLHDITIDLPNDAKLKVRQLHNLML